MTHFKDLDEYREVELLEELARRAQLRQYGRCDYCGRFRDEGEPCKFPRRHMLAMTIEEAKEYGH